MTAGFGLVWYKVQFPVWDEEVRRLESALLLILPPEMEMERFTTTIYSIEKTKKKTMMRRTNNMRKMKKTSQEKMTIKEEVRGRHEREMMKRWRKEMKNEEKKKQTCG